MRRGGWRFWGLLFAVVAVLAASCTAPSGGAPIPAGGPGSDGPCSSTRTNIRNPTRGAFAVSIFEPTGTGTPWTGGTCDDANRPVVLFVHGWLASIPEVHQSFIEHLTSQGFVVVFSDYPNEFEPTTQYRIMDAGLVAGVEKAKDRIDLTRVGVIGHSLGGGMTPWEIQQAASRG